jgi:hypothetical protein
MMNNYLKVAILLSFIYNISFAQVGIGTTSPNASSILDISSTTAGLLAPRMSAAQKTAIVSPATGLLIYQTDGTTGFYYYNGSSWVTFTSVSAYTFTNGLTNTAGTVKLGGALTGSTTVSIPSSYDLTFQGTTSGASAFSNIYFKRPLTTTPNIAAKTVMDINFYDDYVNFGDGYSSPPSSDGTTFTDTGGTTFTKDFVAGFYSGNSGGTGIAMGSIEEYLDGTAEFLFNYRLCPIADGGTTLGSSAKRWSTVYATNGTINTSDANLKKDITSLNYGLKEILELKPVTFKWKDEYASANQKVPDDKKATKIGFLAQDLLQVIPEVVQTHSWQITDEKKPAEYLPNKNLGVFYSDIIPVAVKAIQEQQTEIELLKKLVEKLDQKIETLANKKS